MQSEAYKITGFTAVAAAMGFLLRWLQDLRILDETTGLATRGAGISVLVVLVFLAVAAVIGFFAWRLERYDAPLEPAAALGGEGFWVRAVYVLPAVLFFVAGFVQLITANAEHYPETQITMQRVCGAAYLLAGGATGMIASNLDKPDRLGVLRGAMGALILASALWLITEYKSAATDPVIWRFAPEILAVCASLMTYYYVAGYFYTVPAPRASVFFCFMAAFLCVVSAVDEHPLAETISYIAAAAQFFAWGYRLVWNLKPAGMLTSPAPESDAGAETE